MISTCGEKMKTIQIGDRLIGGGQPTYIIAEVGVNHNGNLEIAKKLIDAAVAAGCDAIKFQKRTPDICVPPEQRDIRRETPWGNVTYLEYRHHIEFGQNEYEAINDYCKIKGIKWFASCWDGPSVNFLEQFNPVCHKICSASLTDDDLIKRINAKGRPVILSTGMSTMEEICHAVSLLDQERLLIAHCTSSYACKAEELNLRMIRTLRNKYDCPIGYSGHELGFVASIASVALGASFVERHITIDRTMWGSDQIASLEPQDLQKLVKDIRDLEKALGDGVKRVYESEVPILKKLRKCR